jgi:hypothetical protein
MNSTGEKALKAIMKSEQSRQTYKKIKALFGKSQNPLTQIDILSNPDDLKSPITTLTSRDEVKHHLLKRNRNHSLQALSTPFITNPTLS